MQRPKPDGIGQRGSVVEVGGAVVEVVVGGDVVTAEKCTEQAIKINLHWY